MRWPKKIKELKRITRIGPRVQRLRTWGAMGARNGLQDVAGALGGWTSPISLPAHQRGSKKRRRDVRSVGRIPVYADQGPMAWQAASRSP